MEVLSQQRYFDPHWLWWYSRLEHMTVLVIPTDMRSLTLTSSASSLPLCLTHVVVASPSALSSLWQSAAGSVCSVSKV